MGHPISSCHVPVVSSFFIVRDFSIIFKYLLGSTCHAWTYHLVLSQNFAWCCQSSVSYSPNFDLYCPKIHLILSEESSCTVPNFTWFLLNPRLVLSQFQLLLSKNSLHFVKRITLYCPQISPDFAELASCTFPILTYTFPKFTIICQKTCLDFNLISNCFLVISPISSCHVPVVSSFLILLKTLVSFQSIGYLHFDTHELFTLYCPKISPYFLKLASCIVPIMNCSVSKCILFCQKNHPVLS